MYHLNRKQLEQNVCTSYSYRDKNYFCAIGRKKPDTNANVTAASFIVEGLPAFIHTINAKQSGK